MNQQGSGLDRAAIAGSSGTIDIRTEKTSSRIRISISNPADSSTSFALLTQAEVDQLIAILMSSRR